MQYYRVNWQIRASKVRLLDEQRKSLGIVPLEEALRLARKEGRDLVEIAPQADPPVCQILDFAKFLYEQRKHQRRERGRTRELKEIRLSSNVARHDLEKKAERARLFLEDGHPIRVSVLLRGREQLFPHKAEEVIETFRAALGGEIKTVGEMKQTGNIFAATFQRGS